MRHQDLWRLLKVGSDRHQREFAFCAHEIADQIAAHKKVDPAEQQHQRSVRLRAAGNDGDVESVLSVDAVGQGLKEPARLSVGRQLVANLTLSSATAGSAKPTHAAKAASSANRVRTPRSYGFSQQGSGAEKRA